MNSDWNLLKEARSGSQKAWEELFERYSKSLANLAALITGSTDSAKDIVQETFIRLLQVNVKHFEGSFKTYITTTAYRFALKEKSRFKKIVNFEENDFNDSSASVTEIKLDNELQNIVFKAITSLPENQKEILVLRFYSRLSYEDISEVCGLPLGTVKSRIYYAVRACRKILKENGVPE